MATIKTLYSTLGLDPMASFQDIDDALMRAKIRYPQAKLDADENLRIQFLAMRQAHATLSSPESRAAYDKRLARSGVEISGDHLALEGSSWGSTRNIIVGGIIVLLVSGMWAYYAHQRTKAEKEIAERALRLVEEEKRRQAEAEEQRRQSQISEEQRRRAEMQERQFQIDSQRTAVQVNAHLRQVDAQLEAAERRKQQEKANEERQRQLQQRQQEQDAARRLQEEKRQLQVMCMRHYGRNDC